jgi:signal transduction protein with GAF and PtsI domain
VGEAVGSGDSVGLVVGDGAVLGWAALVAAALGFPVVRAGALPGLACFGDSALSGSPLGLGTEAQ